MKRLLVIAGATLLAGLGCFLLVREKPLKDQAGKPESSQGAVVRTSQKEAVSEEEEIFKRAFWKRPGPQDKILHAERQEWMDEGGQMRWQWFIVVVPSPALVMELCEDNVFSLVPTNGSVGYPDAPSWFTFDQEAFDGLQSPTGNLRLFFGRAQNLLYATDSGGDFNPGAPEPVNPVHYSEPTGRLPNSPPPIPPGP